MSRQYEQPVKEKETALGTARYISANGSTLTEVAFNDYSTDMDCVLRIKDEGENTLGVLYYPEIRSADGFEKIRPFFDKFGFSTELRDVYEFFKGSNLEGEIDDMNFVLTQGKKPGRLADFMGIGVGVGAFIGGFLTAGCGHGMIDLFPDFMLGMNKWQLAGFVGGGALASGMAGAALGAFGWYTTYGKEVLSEEGQRLLDDYQRAFEHYSACTTEFDINQETAENYESAKAMMDDSFSKLESLITAIDSEGEDVRRPPGFYIVHRDSGEDRIINNFRNLLAA